MSKQSAAREQLEKQRAFLNQPDLNLMAFCKNCPVGYNTLRAIRSGMANPTIELMDKLQIAIDRHEVKNDN